jgi:serine/threonine protein kinase/tetratricopeptide (TPR) repeat protein
LTLQAGFEIGPYRVLAPIGAGGMGEVYRARDTKLDRDVALKVLPPDVASAEALRRFEQEARAASSLNHPNIVAIYDVGRVDSIAYIAMELVEGQTLRGLMAAGPMQLKEALRVAGKVADVLASAHERGVTHRDLKPENVMIARDGYVKLLDFGLAKVRLNIASGDHTQPQTHTTAGHVFGTAAYMSPEQAAGRPVDFRSDQFSLGIILYEMIAGRRPFDRDSSVETLTAIIRDDAPPLPNAAEGSGRELQQVLNRCLAKSPHDRYASTRDLARDLRDLRNRLTSGSDSTERSLRTFRMTAPRLPVIGAVTAVLLVLTAATLVVTRSRSAVGPSPSPRSLAVAPFRDLSGSADGQILSDGISEMISARIAQARGLRVIPPFDGAPQKGDPLEVARRRGASLLLTGGVQHAGEGLRVSFQVQDATTGQRVAGDMVTAQSADVFSLEDLIADRVLQALNVSRTHPIRVASALTGKDQRTYAEAIGLLQRLTDEQSLDRAIHSLDGLLENARDSALVNGSLGKALLRKYSLTNDRALVDQAAIYAERAVQLDASEPEAHITLGELQRISGKLPEAAASFQRALTLRPDSIDARLGLADTYDALGRSIDADHLYRSALELRPDSPDVYGRYGRFCMKRGRNADAVRLYTKQTQILPDAPRSWYNLGAALLNSGRYEDATKALQHSLAIEPTRGGYANLGTCYFWLGRYADAAAAYEKAAALQPKQYVVWANLGDAYRWAPGQRAKSLQPYKTSIALAREALAVNPNDVLARAIAASCMAKTGDLAAAQMELNIALRQDPTNARALYQAAVIASIRGDRDAARAWLQRAIAAGASAADAKRDPELSSVNKPQA